MPEKGPRKRSNTDQVVLGRSRTAAEVVAATAAESVALLNDESDTSLVGSAVDGNETPETPETPATSGDPSAAASSPGGEVETTEEGDEPGSTSEETRPRGGGALPTWTYAADGTSAPAPPTPPTSSAPPLPRGASFGIVGPHRMPAVVLILGALTLGLYGLIWHGRINREMSDFDTRMHVRSGRSTWAVTLPWLAGFLASTAGLTLLLGGSGLHPTLPFGLTERVAGVALTAGLVVVPYLELLFPLSLVAIVMTAERVRVCEDRVGLTTDVQVRPASVPGVLLIPVIGPAILMIRLQSRLNGVWERVAPPASSRRHRS